MFPQQSICVDVFQLSRSSWWADWKPTASVFSEMIYQPVFEKLKLLWVVPQYNVVFGQSGFIQNFIQNQQTCTVGPKKINSDMCCPAAWVNIKDGFCVYCILYLNTALLCHMYFIIYLSDYYS